MKYGSDIPYARTLISATRDSLRTKGLADAADELDVALSYMFRDRRVRNTPVRHGPPTKAQIAKVKMLAHTTDYSQQKIGEITGVNSGRVSEILHGRR